MKAMTITLAAVMAAGCTTTEYEHLRPSAEEVAAYEAWKAKQPKIKFQPGTDMMGIVPSTVVFQDAPAPVQQQAPQPIIVTGPGSPPITTASQVGGTTIISTIGNRAPIGAPIYRTPAHGYYGY